MNWKRRRMFYFMCIIKGVTLTTKGTVIWCSLTFTSLNHVTFGEMHGRNAELFLLVMKRCYFPQELITKYQVLHCSKISEEFEVQWGVWAACCHEYPPSVIPFILLLLEDLEGFNIALILSWSYFRTNVFSMLPYKSYTWKAATVTRRLYECN